MSDRSVLVVTHGPAPADALADAAALAVSAAGSREDRERRAVLVDLGGERRWRSTVLATEGARALAGALAEPIGERRWYAASRGSLCLVSPGAGAEPESAVGGLRELLASVAPAPAIVHAPSAALGSVLAELRDRVAGVVVRTEGGGGRALAGAVAIELRRRGLAVKVWRRPPGAIQSRRALAGVAPGGELSRRAKRAAAVLDGPRDRPRRRRRTPRRAPLSPRAETGQAP